MATCEPELRASLKLQDYNPRRDFVRWGAPVHYQDLAGMPCFTHRAALPRVDPDAQAISCASILGDAKPAPQAPAADKPTLIAKG